MAWTVLAALFVSWGMPLLAVPSAGQVALLLELTAFGFVAAFAISAAFDAWAQMVRRQL